MKNWRNIITISRDLVERSVAIGSGSYFRTTAFRATVPAWRTDARADEHLRQGTLVQVRLSRFAQTAMAASRSGLDPAPARSTIAFMYRSARLVPRSISSLPAS